MVQFGIYLTGTIGYGLSILFVWVFFRSGMDSAVAKKSEDGKSPDGYTADENAKSAAQSIATAAVLAFLTTVVVSVLSMLARD